MELIEVIEYYCSLKGISKYRLCKESGISDGIIADLKSKRAKDIKLSTASKIAKALDITIDELYYGNNIDVNSPRGEIGSEER